VIVVHDETATREVAVSALRSAGLEAVGFDDPMKALLALEAGTRARVLVTRVDFGPGKPNGVALGLMGRLKRPGLKVVFVATEEVQPYTEGVGEFLPLPLDPEALAATVGLALRTN
jgi:DNA-binding NtrC family response regulator